VRSTLKNDLKFKGGGSQDWRDYGGERLVVRCIVKGSDLGDCKGVDGPRDQGRSKVEICTDIKPRYG
jgi:hypothetical protein